MQRSDRARARLAATAAPASLGLAPARWRPPTRRPRCRWRRNTATPIRHGYKQPADRLDRDVALAALAQAEDNLTLPRDLGTALTDQRAAADTARRSVALSHPHYREGAVG